MSSFVAETSHRSTAHEIATAAYRLAAAGVVTNVHPWQSLLYERLAAADSDAGFLLLTPCGSGKADGVIIPSVGLQRGGAPRRVFVIAAEGCPLDDYVERLARYLKAFALADETPRTLYIDEADGERDGTAFRFAVDGDVEAEISINPLEADVDVVLTTVGRFLDLFFGSGGVHGLPSALAMPDGENVRRDVFFFDEAHSYSAERFSRFLRLVEFLFAQDTDIVVGSSTMPASFQEELSFLEAVRAEAPFPPATITYIGQENAIAALASETKARWTGRERLAVVVESAADADAVAQLLGSDFSAAAYRYHPGSTIEERRRIYNEVLQSESFLVIATGAYWQTSNLDADTVLTTLCLPESLVLRAGRCNRRGTAKTGQIVVAGTGIVDTVRTLNNAQQSAYMEALRHSCDTPFDPVAWRAFL